MKKDDGLKKRYIELANKSYNQGIYTFTEFLGLSEQSVLSEIEDELRYVGVSKWGGISDCERVVVRFGKEEDMGYEEKYPIVCLIIKPVMQKFADDLTHRDILGALMNLGITREKLGDIILHKNEAYVFCIDKIADYICDNLTRVRHTTISILIEDEVEKIENLSRENYNSCIITVDSKRLDAIIAKVYKISRNTSVNLFKTKKIFVNGKLCMGNSTIIKDGDIVSIRGKGRIKYMGNESETKKGRIRMEVWKL